MSQHADKIDQEEATKVKAAVETAKEKLIEHANNPEELEKAANDLMQASHKVAEQMYKEKQAQEAGQQPDAQHDAADAQAKANSDTIDADITE